MENGLTVIDTPDTDLRTYLGYYEESVDASRTAREKAERDRDYYDGKQLTTEEYAELQKRGQPPIAMNLIREHIDYLLGLETEQRSDPKGSPRNPGDQAAADAFTSGLRYVSDAAEYHTARSAAWKNMVIEGFGGIEIAAVEDGEGGYDFTAEHVAWDRLIYDPHSTKPDFSDAKYVGQVIWMDEEEALERALANGADEALAAAVISTTLSGVESGNTYDDRPKDTIWADAKRKRVRICVMWVKKGATWWVVEFTRGGILSEMESPYRTKKGQSLCLLVLESDRIDRDNNRYGEVRDLIDPQDEGNKRRSKALHLVNTAGVIMDAGAVADKDQARRELARPDFLIETTPGAKFEVVRQVELATGQAQLGQQAVDYIARRGANAALRGKGTENQSGRAIEAQQAGGMVGLGGQNDILRKLDRRVYRLFAALMQQFWTAERWIITTDDPLSPEHVGLNVPLYTNPQTGETLTRKAWEERAEAGEDIGQPIPATDPRTGQPLVENNVAELVLDVMVEEAPDTLNNSVEAYQALSQSIAAAVQGQVPAPLLTLMIKAHPSLPTRLKKEFLDALDKMSNPPPEAQQAQQAQMQAQQERAAAELEEVRARTFKTIAEGERAAHQTQQPQFLAPAGDEFGPIAA